MKTDSESSVAQTPEDVLNELHALIKEAEARLNRVPAVGCDCETALADLRERLEAARERMAAFYRAGKEKVIAGAKHTDEAIRENPYASIAIALGIGLLAGALMSRRSSTSAR